MKKILFLLKYVDHRSSGIGVATAITAVLIKEIGYCVKILSTQKKPVRLSDMQVTVPIKFIDSKPDLLIKQIEIEKPDLIILSGLRSSLLTISLKIKKRLNIPLIVIPHGVLTVQSIKSNNKKRLNFLINSLNHADRVIFVSDHEKNYGRVLGVRDNVTMIHNTIDEDQSLRSTLDDRETALFVGRIVEEKGVFLLLEAWKEYITYPGNKKLKQLLIAGYGTKKNSAKLKQMVLDLNIEETVIIKGHVSRLELNNLYNRAKVLVLPTVMDAKPLVILEAWRHNVIVLTTRESGYNLNDCGLGIVEIRPTIESILDEFKNIDIVTTYELQTHVCSGLAYFNRYHNRVVIKSQYQKLLKELL
jgi:glycosyltransferase involved in cell wall biosynthesis